MEATSGSNIRGGSAEFAARRTGLMSARAAGRRNECGTSLRGPGRRARMHGRSGVTSRGCSVGFGPVPPVARTRRGGGTPVGWRATPETAPGGCRRRQGGWQILGVLIVIVIVSYGTVNTAMVAAMSQIQIARARENAIVASACASRLDEPAPSGSGGSIWPEAPVGGWTDVVYADRAGDRLTPLRLGERAPDGATVVRRQWRVREASGVRVIDASAELADVDGGRHPSSVNTVRSLRRNLP